MIGVCLAIYNPNLEYLEKQILSIKQQTFQEWVCYITDDSSDPFVESKISALIQNDARFSYKKNLNQLGVIKNFELSMLFALGNPNVSHIALADQDDIWVTNKLKDLMKCLNEHNAQLCHSDASVINSKDEVIADSLFFLENRSKHFDLLNLTLRNSVTGCCSFFTRSLAEESLPFNNFGSPPSFYHDLWLALIASMSPNGIVYLDTATTKYRKHNANLVGPKASRVKYSFTTCRIFRTAVFKILLNLAEYAPSQKKGQVEDLISILGTVRGNIHVLINAKVAKENLPIFIQLLIGNILELFLKIRRSKSKKLYLFTVEHCQSKLKR